MGIQREKYEFNSKCERVYKRVNGNHMYAFSYNEADILKEDSEETKVEKAEEYFRLMMEEQILIIDD